MLKSWPVIGTERLVDTRVFSLVIAAFALSFGLGAECPMR